MSAGTGRYLAVAGNMGAGKSTLVDFLKVRFGVTPFFEPNDQNPYLADFYRDMPRWAFQSQLYFLQKKFALHQELEKLPGLVVQDRTIYEDAEVFCENLYRSKVLDARDYRTYRELYETIRGNLRAPDLLIYLKCSVRTVRKRIALRGRAEETSVQVEYVKRLNRLYDAWFERYDLSPTLVIETDRLDYIQDMLHRIDLMETIGAHITS